MSSDHRRHRDAEPLGGTRRLDHEVSRVLVEVLWLEQVGRLADGTNDHVLLGVRGRRHHRADQRQPGDLLRVAGGDSTCQVAAVGVTDEQERVVADFGPDELVQEIDDVVRGLHGLVGGRGAHPGEVWIDPAIRPCDARIGSSAPRISSCAE